jgi:GT2 family glycosyltransferase
LTQEYASPAQVTASVVSHRHGPVVASLLTDLATQSGSYCFCVLNPDVQIGENPLQRRVEELRVPGVGVVTRRILNPDGNIEDGARRFPTPRSIVPKLFGLTSELDYRMQRAMLWPDWVAGMFMLFRKKRLC